MSRSGQNLYDENAHLVELYYAGHLDDLKKSKKRHWLLRHYLWFGDKMSKEKLDKIKSDYIGKNDSQTRAVFQKKYNRSLCRPIKIKAFAKYRKRIYRDYPLLQAVGGVMFHALMGGGVFKRNLRPFVKKVVPVQEVIEIRKKLLDNPRHIAMISTVAINFLSNSEWCYELKPVDPKYFLNVVLKEYDESNIDHVRLEMYMLTHCIIGGTKFYTRPIKNNLKIYIRMMKKLDSLLEKNYKKVSLDIKCEMLMCARLCGYKSRLEGKILDEAQKSLAEQGDYLVNKLNSYRIRPLKSLSAMEHSNILYIMALHEPRKRLLPK